MSKFDTLVEIFSESTKRYGQSPLFGEKRAAKPEAKPAAKQVAK